MAAVATAAFALGLALGKKSPGGTDADNRALRLRLRLAALRFQLIGTHACEHLAP
ncbi:MAG: hypothetical protein JHD07_20835 [Bradyrhizobium sp.]|jgi:hypothetical protein|uniref:hypothetical protein n=1 Tax=Bradyrhizobium TaxID=374 RepID=UPI00042288BD|nr:hypothetical protein [Bradyrhizobium sp.]